MLLLDTASAIAMSVGEKIGDGMIVGLKVGTMKKQAHTTDQHMSTFVSSWVRILKALVGKSFLCLTSFFVSGLPVIAY